MGREARYQAAVVRDGRLLLLRYGLRDREFWCLPGGGRENESEEECVEREVYEETNLEVRVVRFLFEMPAHPSEGFYRRWRTYLCEVIGGAERPGFEPDFSEGVIRAIRWLDLRSEPTWGSDVIGDAILYPQLARIREELALG